MADVQLFEPTDPLAKYKIADLDNAGDPAYFGFIDKEGGWYILKLTATAARYTRGASNYSTAWTGRVGLTYNYLDIIF